MPCKFLKIRTVSFYKSILSDKQETKLMVSEKKLKRLDNQTRWRRTIIV